MCYNTYRRIERRRKVYTYKQKKEIYDNSNIDEKDIYIIEEARWCYLPFIKGIFISYKEALDFLHYTIKEQKRREKNEIKKCF
jgi:hypothetical protein